MTLFYVYFAVIAYCVRGKLELLLKCWREKKKKSEIIRKTNNKPSIPGNEGGPSINEAELERPLLSTSGPFDHLPHCQVPPAECFIISPSKCLRLAKSTEALLCATRCHSGLLGSTGEQQGFWEIINGGEKNMIFLDLCGCVLCKDAWSVWQEWLFVSICGIYEHTRP